MTNQKEIPGDFYDLEYYLSMEWRYLSEAHGAKVRLLKKILGDVKGKCVLDIGCGGGYFTHIVSKQGAKAVGVDYSESAILFGKDRYPELDLRVGNAKTIKEFEAGYFDVVLLIDVIEHVFDQRAILSEIYKILKPGGVVIISTDVEKSPWTQGRFSWFMWQTYRFSKEGRAYRLIKKVEEERSKKKNYHDSHVAIRSVTDLVTLIKHAGFNRVEPKIYALVRVPLRDFILKFFSEKWRGDHVLIKAEKLV